MARCDSVTVSIAADETGMFTDMFRVNFVVVSTSVGRTPLRAGTSETSSNVRASGMSLLASIVKTSRILIVLLRATQRVGRSARAMLANLPDQLQRLSKRLLECKLGHSERLCWEIIFLSDKLRRPAPGHIR